MFEWFNFPSLCWRSYVISQFLLELVTNNEAKKNKKQCRNRTPWFWKRNQCEINSPYFRDFRNLPLLVKFLVVFKLPQNPMLSTVWWSPPSRSKCIPWSPVMISNWRWRHRSLRSALCWSYAKLNDSRGWSSQPSPPRAGFFAKTWNRGGCYEFWTETFSKMKGPRLVSKNQNSHEDKCSNRNGSWGLRALGRDCQWNVQFESFYLGKGGHSQSMVIWSSLLLNFG